MEQTKVISFRFDESTIKLIDDAVKRQRYWKRNALVEQLLFFVLSKLSDEDIYDIIRTYKYDRERFTALHLELTEGSKGKC